jgi:hypothetical protein
MTTEPWWITAAIVAGSAASGALVWLGAHRVARRELPGREATRLSVGLALYLGAWFAAALVLGIRGFFQADATTQVPPVAYALAPLVIGGLAPFVWAAFRKVVDAVPLPSLIGVQAFRVLGGLFLVQHFRGTLPGLFAWPAGVGDILVGLAAPLVAWLVRSGHPSARPVAVAWNVLGIADLLLAVTMGVLTSPGPFHRLALDDPNRTIAAFPNVLVPTFAVPLWLVLHFFGLYRLLGRRPAEAADHPQATGRSVTRSNGVIAW